MAITLKELYESNTNTGLQSSSATRTFIAKEPGVGVTVPQTYGLEGLPSFNDPHPHNGRPGFFNLYVTGVNRVPEGRSVRITVLYGSTTPSSGGGSIIPVNPLADGFLSVETSFTTATITLPVFQQAKVIVNGTGGQTVTRYAWQLMEGDWSFETIRHTFTATLNGRLGEGFTLDAFLAAGAVIRNQANNIHEIGGTRYRFFPRRIAQRATGNGQTEAQYEIQYTWEYDPGVPSVLFGQAGYVYNPQVRPGLIFRTNPNPPPDYINAYIQQDEEFMLRPWTRVQTFAQPDNPGSYPVVDFTQVYKTGNLNGWQTLPGLA